VGEGEQDPPSISWQLLILQHILKKKDSVYICTVLNLKLT